MSFLLKAEKIPLMDIQVLTESLVSGHLGYLHLLATVNSATMNSNEQS